jgi:hypothetical protein
MNTKEITAIRQSLRLIATGDTMGARRMLAQLTIATRPAAAKPVRSTKAKAQPGYSERPDPNTATGKRYAADWYAATQTGVQGANMANAVKLKLESKESIASRLSTCACGHGSAAHTPDSLENLLACSADKCKCDHFHYQLETESAAAAR